MASRAMFRIIGVLKAKLFVLTLNGDKRMKLKESAIWWIFRATAGSSSMPYHERKEKAHYKYVRFKNYFHLIKHETKSN